MHPHILSVSDNGDIALTKSSQIRRDIDNARDTAINTARNEMKALDTRLEGRVNARIEKRVTDVYNHANKHRGGLATRVLNIENRERSYMQRNTSYSLRTTNMNMEHCLTDENHDRRNNDRWDKAEWYNVQRQRNGNACIKVKFRNG